MCSERIERSIANARRDFADRSDNDIEIDEHPAVSESKSGCWIAAWVWVPDIERQGGHAPQERNRWQWHLK